MGGLHVGAGSSYTAAAFCEVVQPSSRRVVMRIDFDDTTRADRLCDRPDRVSRVD